MRKIGILTLAVLFAAATAPPANAQTMELTLTGPSTFEPGVLVTGFSGRLIARTYPVVRMPAQSVEIIVDGVIHRTVRTDTDGRYSAQIGPFAKTPVARTVVARAYGGTPLEVSSEPIIVRSRARLTVVPSQVDLGSLVGGRDSRAVEIAVTNDGGMDSGPISEFAEGADIAIVSSACAEARLAAGATCSMSVLFTADQTGSRFGTIRLGASPGGAVTVPIRATVRGVSAPSAIDFGRLFAGQSITRSISIVNDSSVATGPVALTMSSSPHFSMLTDGCTGQALQPGAACSVSIVFSPTDRGGLAATLVVSSSPGGSSRVTLAGVGAFAELELRWQELWFSRQAPYNRQTITTVNVGDVTSLPLTASTCCVEDFTIPSSADRCSGVALAPGQSCTLDVLFTRTEPGWAYGTLIVQGHREERATTGLSGV